MMAGVLGLYTVLATQWFPELVQRDLAERLQKMVGFRNVAVHRYRDLDVAVLVSVIRNDLEDLLHFAAGVARHA